MALTTMAQDSDWGSFYFGVRAGVDVGYLRENPGTPWSTSTSGKAGFNVGVVAGIPVFKKYLYLEPGVYIAQKGAEVVHSWVSGCWYDPWDNVDYCDEHTELEQKMTSYYVEIPVLVSARLDLSDNLQFQLNVGPYFAFGIGGNCKDYTPTYNKYDIFGDKGSFRTFDCGISMGVSFLFNKHYWIGYQYELGLTNLYKENSEIKDKLYNSNNMISIGYNF